MDQLPGPSVVLSEVDSFGSGMHGLQEVGDSATRDSDFCFFWGLVKDVAGSCHRFWQDELGSDMTGFGVGK